MLLSDQWAERRILDAQSKGEFDNLPGAGAPLLLDDDSAVPEELRVAYRILKNAGYLPAQLLDRKEALDLQQLLEQVSADAPTQQQAEKRLMVLKLRLQQAGMSTDFLDSKSYHHKMQAKFNGGKNV
ncbi:DUF1992 domain-containing protein [Rahnella sp. SAP-1]|uniref:DUF1992 domain-containing protein n=1 Tax=Rouxiella aceris TaxID=2703884 RepID=A0A848MS28_9GAMM|nr:DnaJ family domain-containing protein [Rouxiella aceris]NMP29849.1 DUF1992 domain-containing protein [Rouxiella aceris]